MSKGGEIEKVVVIQTCIDLSWSEMKWMLNALPINPGDEIIFLGVLQLTNSSTSSFLSAAKLCEPLSISIHMCVFEFEIMVTTSKRTYISMI